MPERRIETWVIGAVCGYELAAYATGLPTITNLALRLPVAARRGLIVVVFGWMVRHFDCGRSRL